MKNGNKRAIRALAWIGFVIYLIAMVYFLFFCERLGRIPSDTYHYNLEPFTEIKRCLNHISELGSFYVTLNLLGNVICLMPLGFVLPILSKRRMGVIRITFISFLSSLFVELLQLVTKLGSCDVDDIIMNTLGGFWGYILFVLCRGIYHMGAKKR